jgi:hypothetical protein
MLSNSGLRGHELNRLLSHLGRTLAAAVVLTLAPTVVGAQELSIWTNLTTASRLRSSRDR